MTNADVRRWIAIAMTFYVILMWLGHAAATSLEMPTLDGTTLAALTGPALGLIGWFFRKKEE